MRTYKIFLLALVASLGAWGQSSTSSPGTGGLGIWNLGWPPQQVVPPNTPPVKPPPQQPLGPNQSWKTEKECIGGQFYNVKYKVTKNADGSTFSQFDSKTATGEDCSQSTDPNANSAPNVKPQDSILYKLRHPGSFNSNNNTTTSPYSYNFTPLPPPTQNLRAHAATPGPAPTAFTMTLPYRSLPAPPLYNLADQALEPQPNCLSQLNPTVITVNHSSSTVTRSNLCTDQIVAVIQVPSNPLQVEVTPDGSQAVVTSYDNGITFISTTTNKVTSTINTPFDFTPSGIAISPDGTYALVTNYEPAGPGGAALALVDIANQKIVSTHDLDADYPQSVFLNPDATLAWVTYPWVDLVEVIDVGTGNVNQAFNVSEPFGVAFNPTGTVAYISSGGGGVYALETTTYKQIGSVGTAVGSSDLLVSPEGESVLVNNNLANSITIFDAGTFASQTFSVPGMPRGAVLVPTQ
ncbi:MAG TPA: YncE family protein [Bryobacteraceae bacterium]|nr:YncE family protein [Bryobacteraceae bacterium]